MADVDALVEEATESLDEIGCDTGRLTQEESLDFYRGIKQHAQDWIENIEHDLD
jgi:hypothetical protein